MQAIKTIRKGDLDDQLKSQLKVGDRRKASRVSRQFDVRCKFKKTEANLFGINVGEGGLRVFSNIPLPRNTRINLTLNFGNGVGDIKTVGKVVWQRRFSPTKSFIYGVKFIEIEPRDQEKIFRLVMTEGKG